MCPTLTVRSCSCPLPRESPNPRRVGICNVCGYRIDPRWTSNDKTFAEFYDRLEASVPGGINPAFRELAADRERMGRARYGLRFLSQDNVQEAFEEAADLANYAFFKALQGRRDGLEDAQIDLLLTAAQKAAEAFDALALVLAKEAGSPTSFSGEETP